MAVSTFRRKWAFAATGVLLAAVAVQQACVIAQPSQDVPRLPATRPTIVHASVAPSTTSVLATFPPLDTFTVPVEVLDPSVPIAYAAFIDYNPLTGSGLVVSPVTVNPSADAVPTLRVLSIAIPPPADLGRCHVIEVVVALTLNGHDGFGAHTPDPPGGDIVSWFYNPGGSIDGCPSLDAGLDAAPDADAQDGL